MRADDAGAAVLPEPLLAELADFVTERLGLRCPRDRWGDLSRAVQASSQELESPSAEECARCLMSTPPARTHLEFLARYLANGETYFSRETPSIAALQYQILPELVAARRMQGPGARSLRIWSAGCATGEEPYTIAMLLELVIPDLDDRHIALIATDINPDFLRTAEKGRYREWSFRGVPQFVKDRFFSRFADGWYELDPRVRRRVAFSYLNLAGSDYPSALTNTAAMDLILCRNVLMYFEPPRAKQAVRRLADALKDGGWLLAGAAECSSATFEGYETVRMSGATFYRKRTLPVPAPDSRARPKQRPAPVVAKAPTIPPPPIAEPAETRYEAAFDLFRSGRYAEAAETARGAVARAPLDAKWLTLLARIHANSGTLDAALEWVGRAIAANKIDPAAHYVHATILIEMARHAEAAHALNRAVYLAPDFVLAHYTLGVLARHDGDPAAAKRNFETALSILARHDPDASVDEADDLNSARLIDIVRAMRDLTEQELVS